MKKYKYLPIQLIALLLFAQFTFAQKDSSGIYKTTKDFQLRKLSYAINCITEKHKINTYEFFNDSEVKVTHDGIVHKFNKRDIFGYRNCDGKEFRFVDNKEYNVLNPGESLIIYKYQRSPDMSKNKIIYKPEYFFSANGDASMQTLTKQNIKALYSKNHKFHDALDAQFKNDEDLVAYDDFHKTYKLNWVIKNNVK